MPDLCLLRIPSVAESLTFPRSARACRAVGNAPRGPSSVRWVPFAIIAAHISRRTTC